MTPVDWVKSSTKNADFFNFRRDGFNPDLGEARKIKTAPKYQMQRGQKILEMRAVYERHLRLKQVENESLAQFILKWL
jgi:hypothetical protein